MIRKKTIESLWAQTKDVLVLIDRGTPYGSYIIRRARAQILNMAEKRGEDVHVVAPVSSYHIEDRYSLLSLFHSVRMRLRARWRRESIRGAMLRKGSGCLQRL